MWKAIDVPQYVADEFNQPMRHPSQNPGAIGRSVERVFRLVGEALEGIQGLGWEINETPFHSVERLEPYGFEWAGNKFIIYAEQCGQKMHWPYSRIVILLLTISFGLFPMGLEKLIGKCSSMWCRESQSCPDNL